MDNILVFILFTICALASLIAYSIYIHKKNKNLKIETILLAATTSLIGAMVMSALWLYFYTKSELFSALCNLVILILTVAFSFIQYALTLENKKRFERENARPEIINPNLLYNKLKKEIVFGFMLFSNKKQPVMDINGELFLSFDSKAKEYIHCGHFDNIGTQVTGKDLKARIDPFKHKSNYDRAKDFVEKNKLFSDHTGFEYLIYFRTRELENGVAVYLHGTNGYMAYYSKKNKTWYKYDQQDKNISNDQIKIIEEYKP